MIVSILTEGYVRLGFSIVVLIILLWILIRFRAKRNPKPGSLEILRKRLEKGEVTEEEYEAARKKQEGK